MVKGKISMEVPLTFYFCWNSSVSMIMLWGFVSFPSNISYTSLRVFTAIFSIGTSRYTIVV